MIEYQGAFQRRKAPFMMRHTGIINTADPWYNRVQELVGTNYIFRSEVEMFREMRRFKQQISEEECIKVLASAPRGILAVLGDDDYPYTVPIDYIFDAAEKKIYFHCAAAGHKIDAIKKHDKVSFCVYDEGFRKEGDWALNIKSVIVFGRLRPIEDRERTIETARRIGLKYYPDSSSVDKEVEKDGRRVLCLELIIEHMTGKLVNES